MANEITKFNPMRTVYDLLVDSERITLEIEKGKLSPEVARNVVASKRNSVSLVGHIIQCLRLDERGYRSSRGVTVQIPKKTKKQLARELFQ